MAQIQYIKDLFENEDLDPRENSRRTNHSFSTVKKYAYQDDWGEGELPNLEPEGYSVLGEFIPVIDEWLEADRKVRRKQRHTMWRMFCRLREEHGFTGSSSVKRYVRKKKLTMRAESSGYLPIAHPQGWRQVDLGEVLYYGSDEQEHTGYALTISFPYSNKGYTQITPVPSFARY